MVNKIIKFLIILAFAFNEVTGSPVAAGQLSALRPQKTRGATALGLREQLSKTQKASSAGKSAESNIEFIEKLQSKGLIPDRSKKRFVLSHAAELRVALEMLQSRLPHNVGATPAIQDIYQFLEYVESTNAFDAYRVKNNLPIVVVLRGGFYKEDRLRNPWRIAYTHSQDFESFVAIYGKEDYRDFIIGMGDVKYYRAKPGPRTGSLARMFRHAVRSADVADIRNSLWGIPFNGATAIILHNPESTVNKEGIVKTWASALFNADILGSRFFAKPGTGTAEEQMAWIQQAADDTRKGMGQAGIKVRAYQPAATSRLMPHNKWMATGHGIISTMHASFDVLKIRPEKSTAIVYGFGNIGKAVIRLLSNEGIRIVGVADKDGAIYDPDGLDTKKLLRMKRKGQKVTEYDKRKVISRDELLAKKATVLFTFAMPNIINTGNYSSLKTKIIIDSVYRSLEPGVDMERRLQEEKAILYLPSCLSNGGGAWASSEEIFYNNTDINVPDLKSHVLSGIRNTAFTTTVLLLKMWLASDKKAIPSYMLREIAESIRARRNELLRNPTPVVEERAQYGALVGVPHDIAYLFAFVEEAKDEILYKDEDVYRLSSILSNRRSPAWEKVYAAYVLGRKRDLRAQPALVKALHNKALDRQSPQIRENAAEALGQIWAGGAIEDLLATYNDPDGRAGLKKWSGWALERMGVATHFNVKPRRKTATFDQALHAVSQRVVSRYSYRRKRLVKRPNIVGLSGFSASGKTTFVKQLRDRIIQECKKRFPDRNINVIHLDIDNYLLPKEEREARAERLGIPLSIFIKFEFQRFADDMKRFAARKPIYVPHFDQITRKRERADEKLMAEAGRLATRSKTLTLEIEGEQRSIVKHDGLSAKEQRGVYIDLQTGDILREIQPDADLILLAEGILALAGDDTVNFYDEAVFVDAPWNLRRMRDIRRYIETGKYASLTTEEVNAKFERKRIQEETRYVSSQIKRATYLIDTSDIKVPAYVDAYLKVLEDFQEWLRGFADIGPAKPKTLEEKEAKLDELFISYKLNDIDDIQLRQKVWTRLYQNLIAREYAPAFKAISDFVEIQNEKEWFGSGAKEKVKILRQISGKYELDDNGVIMFTHAAYLQMARTGSDRVGGAPKNLDKAGKSSSSGRKFGPKWMRETYNGIARKGTYVLDKQHGMEAAAETIFGKAIPKKHIKGSRVLDLGTGMGMLAELAARNKAKEVVGFDISSGMLKTARKRLRGFRNIRFVQGDMLHIKDVFSASNKAPKKFNIITIGNVLCYYSAEDKRLILSHAMELLEEGGYLVILYRSFDETDPEPDEPIAISSVRSVNFYRMSTTEYISMLNDLGFADAGFYVGSRETDEDWGIELSELEVTVNENMVIWARKIDAAPGKSSSAGKAQTAMVNYVKSINYVREYLAMINKTIRNYRERIDMAKKIKKPREEIAGYEVLLKAHVKKAAVVQADIRELAAKMKAASLSEFIRAIKEYSQGMDTQDSRLEQRVTTAIKLFFTGHSTLDIDMDKILFVPRNWWLAVTAGPGTDVDGATVDLSDGKESADVTIIFNDAGTIKGAITTIVHEGLHARYKDGARAVQGQKMEIRHLFTILDEAVTEQETEQIIDEVFGLSLEVVSAARKARGKKGLIDKARYYLYEMAFLKGLKEKLGPGVEEVIQEFLLTGNPSSLQELSGKELWDGILRILKRDYTDNPFLTIPVVYMLYRFVSVEAAANKMKAGAVLLGIMESTDVYQEMAAGPQDEDEIDIALLVSCEEYSAMRIVNEIVRAKHIDLRSARRQFKEKFVRYAQQKFKNMMRDGKTAREARGSKTSSAGVEIKPASTGLYPLNALNIQEHLDSAA